jgi:uncharacterized protein
VAGTAPDAVPNGGAAAAARVRPLPVPTPISQPFWDGCRQGRLLVQRCQACDGYVWIPSPMCTHCASQDLNWTETKGHGRVFSFSVIWRPPVPAFEAGYVVGLVELDEGVKMLTNLLGKSSESWDIGDPVRVEFQPVSERIHLPMFRPREEAPSGGI